MSHSALLYTLTYMNVSVSATCEDPGAVIQFSLSGSDKFYVDRLSGEVFLVNNDGLGRLADVTEEYRHFR